MSNISNHKHSGHEFDDIFRLAFKSQAENIIKKPSCQLLFLVRGPPAHGHFF
jgi:hypothetical protein